MGNGRKGEFSEAARAPAVLSVVLEAWLRLVSTPSDLVDILVAAASADLLAGTFGVPRISQSDASYQPEGTDCLDPNAPTPKPGDLPLMSGSRQISTS
jgi:hypothetical protein